MPMILTHHARERMGLRGVTLSMIEKTIFAPDSIGQGYSNKILAFKRFPEGLLKVVYSVEGSDQVVITAIWQEE